MSKEVDFVLYLPQDAGFSVPEECDTWEEDKNGMVGDLGFFERNPELEQLNTLELAKTDLENLLSLDYTEFWNQVNPKLTAFRNLSSLPRNFQRLEKFPM